MMKKILSILLVTVFCVSVLSGCNVGLSGDLKGAHVFMFKMTGGSFCFMFFFLLNYDAKIGIFSICGIKFSVKYGKTGFWTGEQLNPIR